MTKIILILLVGFGAWQHFSKPVQPIEAPTQIAGNMPELVALNSKKGITVFSASWCGYCKKLKAQLTASNVPFTDYDVETSEIGKAYSDANNISGVPVTVVSGVTIHGYDETALNRAFFDAGYTVAGL